MNLWNLWNLWFHNGIKPYISGVYFSRRVHKCKGLMVFFAISCQSCKKNTTFSDNVPPWQFDPYRCSGNKSASILRCQWPYSRILPSLSRLFSFSCRCVCCSRDLWHNKQRIACWKNVINACKTFTSKRACLKVLLLFFPTLGWKITKKNNSV